MLKIRLQRTGRKHEPTFRLVLTDSKNSTKSGRFKEILGSYDPRDKNETTLKADRITHWISMGAQPTDTVHNLLINKEIIKGEKRNVLPKKAPIVKETEDSEKKTEDTPAEGETKPEEGGDAPVEETKEEAPAEPAAEEAKEDAPSPEEKKEEEKPAEETPADGEAKPAEEPKEEEKAAE